MKKAIEEKSVPRCINTSCGGLVKPEIVFFGEALPSDFFENRSLPSEADLCIVMGTSLSVQPFASLPGFCSERVPRVLINGEQVGSLGSRPDDVLLIGDCDSGVRKLAEACGWLEELETLWTQTRPGKAQPKTKAEKEKRDRDQQLQDEVDKLTKEIEANLKMTQDQHTWLDNHVDNKIARAQEEEGAASPTAPLHPGQKVASQPSGTDSKQERSGSGSGLRHVFPWMDKKSSL